MSIGLGTWALGGKAYGNVEKDVALRTIQEAMRIGVRVFDTANIYGDGYAEELIGKTLQNDEEITIITKVGYVKEFSYKQDFSEKAIISSIRGSMERLQRNTLDVVLLHSPDVTVINNKKVRLALESLVNQGIIKKIGVSLRHVDQIPYAASWDACSVIEVIFNLLDQRILDYGYLDLCHENSIDVIAKVPLCFGILTGKYTVGHRFSDQRSRWPIEQMNRWINGAKLFSFLETENRTLSQAALSFCNYHDGITYVIPGAKSPEQLIENTANSRLSENEMSEIRSIWKKHKHLILPV